MEVSVDAIKKYFKDFGVLRETNKAFWGLQGINILDGIFEFAFTMVITVFLSQTIGFTDQEAGYAITIVGIISSVTFLFIGPFVDYLGIRKAIFSGLFAMFVFRLGLIYCAFTPGIPYRSFITLVMIFLSGVPASIIGTVYQIGNKRFTSKKSQAAGFNIWYIFMNIGALFAGLLYEVVVNIQKLPVEYVLLSAIVTTLFSILVAFLTITSNEQYEAPVVGKVWKPKITKHRLIPAIALLLCVDETRFENDVTCDMGKETVIYCPYVFSLVPVFMDTAFRIVKAYRYIKIYVLVFGMKLEYGIKFVFRKIADMGRYCKKIFFVPFSWKVYLFASKMEFWYRKTLIFEFCKNFFREYGLFFLFVFLVSFYVIKYLALFVWWCVCTLGAFIRIGLEIITNFPSFREIMFIVAFSICKTETKFEHHFRGGLAETQVIHPNKSYVDTLINTIEILKKSWKYTREVVTAPQFRRVLAALTLLVGVRAAFLYTGLLMPKYWLRVIGPGAHMGWVNNINPFIIVLGVLLLVPIINRYDTYKMLAWGALLASLTFVPLAIPWYFINGNIIVAYYTMSVVAMLFLSFGEMMWSPRLSHYIVSVAPSGQEGTYSAFASLPWFIGKTLAGGLSGVMLAKWCPEIIITKDTCYSLQGALIEGTILPSYWQTPEAMWLILGVIAIVGPIIMLFLKDWFTVGMKQKV
jgi:MFS family permease